MSTFDCITLASAREYDFRYTPTTATIDLGSQIDLVLTYGPSDVGVAVLTLRIKQRPRRTIHIHNLFRQRRPSHNSAWRNVPRPIGLLRPKHSRQRSSRNRTWKLSENREDAIRNMILAANDLYAQGQVGAAIEQLQALYMKIDGESPPTSPPDFITGDPDILAEFRQIVQDILIAIGS